MHETPSFGSWLRQARVARDLTQEALVEQVGCSTQTVRAFESGWQRPSREMAARLAEILHVPAADQSEFMRRARVPQQAAADLAPHFPDGVAFVALAPVADSAHVVTAFAEAVNCPLRASLEPEAGLRAFLRERAMLLVLDNLEHLLGPQHGSHVSTLLTTILHNAPLPS